MKKHQSLQKNKNQTEVSQGKHLSRSTAFLGMAFCLALGLVLGSLLANYSLEVALPTSAGAPAKPNPTPQTQNAPQLSPADQKELSRLEIAVQKEPKNQENWIQLGNAYFDAQRPDAAIRAYETALRLGKPNPNLLTDLGIMYRQLHRFEDALLSFQQAKALDASHLQCRLNEGIVFFYDLKLKAEAIQSWKEALRLNNEIRMSNGELLSALVERLEKEH